MTDDVNETPEVQEPTAAPEPEVPGAEAPVEPAAAPAPDTPAPQAPEVPVPEPPEVPAAAAPVAPPPPPPPPPPAATPVEALPYEQAPSDSGKVLAALGYLFPIIALVALFLDPYKQEPFVRLHAVQAIGLWVVGMLAWIPVIGWLIGLILFIVAVIGLIKAFQGEYYRIPLLYDVLKGFIEQ